MARLGGYLSLAAIGDMLDAMLGVTPPAKVDPVVVQGVDIVEHHDEALVACILASLELDSIVVADMGTAHGYAPLTHTDLAGAAVGIHLPLAGDELRRSALWQRIGMGEGCLRSPCAKTYATLSRCHHRLKGEG